MCPVSIGARQAGFVLKHSATVPRGLSMGAVVITIILMKTDIPTSCYSFPHASLITNTPSSASRSLRDHYASLHSIQLSSLRSASLNLSLLYYYHAIILKPVLAALGLLSLFHCVRKLPRSARPYAHLYPSSLAYK